MRVKFAAGVPSRDVQEGEVPDSRDLHVIGGLHEVRAADSAVGDQPRAVARLDAPGHLDPLGVADGRVRARLRGSEDAEVVYGVD